eukprot:g3668.t1
MSHLPAWLLASQSRLDRFKEEVHETKESLEALHASCRAFDESKLEAERRWQAVMCTKNNGPRGRRKRCRLQALPSEILGNILHYLPSKACLWLNTVSKSMSERMRSDDVWIDLARMRWNIHQRMGARALSIEKMKMFIFSTSLIREWQYQPASDIQNVAGSEYHRNALLAMATLSEECGDTETVRAWIVLGAVRFLCITSTHVAGNARKIACGILANMLCVDDALLRKQIASEALANNALKNLRGNLCSPSSNVYPVYIREASRCLSNLFLKTSPCSSSAEEIMAVECRPLGSIEEPSHHIFPDNTRALWFELSQTYKSGSLTERSGSRVELSFANGKIYGQTERGDVVNGVYDALTSSHRQGRALFCMGHATFLAFWSSTTGGLYGVWENTGQRRERRSALNIGGIWKLTEIADSPWWAEIY